MAKSSWNTGTRVVDNTTSAVQSTVESVVSEGKQVAEQVVETGGSLWQSVVDQASEALASGGEFVSQFADKASEVLEDTPSPIDTLTEGVANVASSISDFGTSEYRFFAANLFNAGGEFTQDDLNSKDITVLREAVKKAKAEGRNSLDYKDFGTTERDVLKGGPLAGLFDPELRLARTLGGLNFSTNEDGSIVIRNTYNFNKGAKREAYYKAKKAGDDSKALQILSQSIVNPVEAASIIGYARQEELKEAGKPFESEMVINLGKV
jgi:hypothetical protein